jgi:peptidoglycan/xylan/chitin deacetylase (PgdA/CDA1 family)
MTRSDIGSGSILKEAVLHASKRLGLFALARRLTRRGLRILCYHGFELADETRFRPKLFVTLPDFAERMKLLADRGYPVLELGEALERLASNSLPPSAVVITIDDGFHSVRAAAAILGRHRFPATVYVSTYYVQKQAPIFRLAVGYMCSRTTVKQVETRGRDWLPDGVLNMDDPVCRERVARTVIEFGERRCTQARREQICRALGRLLHVDYDRILETRILSLMTRDELQELRRFGVGVQLHTHRHRFPADDEAAAAAEILENRRALQELLGGAYDHFCYPSGLYERRQWPWLERLGVLSATTCEPGLNYPDTPRLALRRFLDDSQVSVITFEAELSGFLELARRARAQVARLSRSWRPGWSAPHRSTGDTSASRNRWAGEGSA